MHIEIFSDTVCPWCFIGKRRLERALAARPDLAPRVTWRAFMLNPTMPPQGMDRREYLAAKFGNDAGARLVYGQVEAAGLEEALAFEFGAIERTPSTVDSHRLIALAAELGADQDAVVERLFRAYFLEGRDIGDLETLVELAAGAGLDAATARDRLASDAGVEAVRAEDAIAREAGIEGVPMFVFDRRYAVSGAQSPDFLLRVMDQAAAPAAAAGP